MKNKEMGRLFQFPTAKPGIVEEKAPIKQLSRLNEAFEWVVCEMGDRSAKEVRFHDLEDLAANYNNHVSIFHRDGWETAIMRIYWPAKELVIYHTIVNFPELEKNSPELTRYFLRNGEYAYLSAMDSEECLRTYGSY